MRSGRNSQCFQILKNISDKQSCGNQTFKDSFPKIVVPSTARKAVFTDQQSRDFIQTVRCKGIDKYLIEEPPTLTQQSCVSVEESRHQDDDQRQYHQIDAIFTELEDCLIQIKSKFTSKVKAQLCNEFSSRQQKKIKCQYHLKNMKNCLHYFKQIASGFLNTHQASYSKIVNESDKLAYRLKLLKN